MDNEFISVSMYDRGSYTGHKDAEQDGALHPLSNIDLGGFSPSTLLDLFYSLEDCARCFGRDGDLMLVLVEKNGKITDGPARSIIQKFNENGGV
ncbi:hypothetical protein A9Q96_09570 [Rhodobacterales bacterium 52_120_T64]|nr:hypothetical protein A9Q96_09570 [Rhodobacterales bacterium 52_120_T64]